VNGDAKVYFYDSKIKQFVANLFNWQSLTSLNDCSISVIVNFKVYKLTDITMTYQQFYEIIQHHNEIGPCCFPCQLTGVMLPCSRCSGNGQLDWVEKVMVPTPINSPPDSYKRDVYVESLKFKVPSKNYVSPMKCFFPDLKIENCNAKNCTVYVSRPHLKDCKDYCPECYGSGTNVIKNCEQVSQK